MSTNSFFVTKQIQQDSLINTYIEHIEEQIEYYTQDIETLLKRINCYTSPEIGEPIIAQCDLFKAGIASHTIRLATLENIKKNQPVSQCDLDLLLLMPVFRIYEKYPHVVSETSEHKQTS